MTPSPTQPQAVSEEPFSWKDVDVQRIRGKREMALVLTHRPTGLMEAGTGGLCSLEQEFRIHDGLMLKLAKRVEMERNR